MSTALSLTVLLTGPLVTVESKMFSRREILALLRTSIPMVEPILLLDSDTREVPEVAMAAKAVPVGMTMLRKMLLLTVPTSPTKRVA
jgi:hypothetical protein